MCGIEHSMMGDSDLTDGIWVWPQGLVHYVDAHQLALPKQFIGTTFSLTTMSCLHYR
jgi:hypothetical protein